MRRLFQYPSQPSGQSANVITRPTAGLNEYLPPVVIADTLMSNLIDIRPYRDDCVMFQADTAITQYGAATTAAKGLVRAAINSDESTAAIPVFYLMTSLAAGWKLIKHTYNKGTAATTLAEFAMSMDGVPADPTLVDSSSAIFKTEADTYYCFTVSHEKHLHFVKHTTSADTYGVVDLPAYPKKIIAHANRIFFIDTANKLWWCRAGDIYSWYAMEYDPDYIVTTEAMGNKALTIALQPNTTRQLTATVTKVGNLDTLGILTIIGTNGLDQPQTAVLTLIEGRVQTSMAFKSVLSATISGWTINGTADNITVGVAPVGLGYVTDDAGYWTLEKEVVLHDFCTMSNNLYIFCASSIYQFQGYSYDTFALTQVIADIGIDRMINPNGYKKVATVHNNAYFVYNSEVYEFDGGNYPKVISRPLVINGQSGNGIMGGISFTGEPWVVTSTADELYLYNYAGLTAYYYIFRFETKTWWKMSGMLKADIASNDAIKIMYIPYFTNQDIYNFISIFSAGQGYVLSEQLGCTQGTTYPFVVTKAFNTNPSEVGTLTDIIIMLQGTAGNTADVRLQFSITAGADDFTDIIAYDNYIFNGDVEIMSILMRIADIINTHHYRLKLSIGSLSSTNPVYVYNIERRFRTKGRSR